MKQSIIKYMGRVIITVLIMFICMPSMNSYTKEDTLKDIETHWAKNYISKLVDKGAIDGYPDGTFKPENFMERASFIKVLTMALELDKQEDTVFIDTVNHWANGYIGAAVQAGILIPDEYDKLEFHPEQSITRVEIAQMITRALEKEAEAAEVDISNLEFVDKDKIHNELKGYVAIMILEGIITGFPDGRFGPDEHATRAQVSVMLVRMLESITDKELQAITFAIFGTDERSTETPRSDIIMLAKYDPSKNNITLISVPRDTRVYIPKVKTDKINHAYAFGGPELLVKTLESLFDTHIDYYMKISFEDFKIIIDTLGGVKVNAKKDFYIGDDQDNVFIEKGEQTLDGEKALFYVRFRKDSDGDFGRIERQQEVIQSLSYETFESRSILILPKLVKIFYENIKSNISLSELLSNTQLVKHIDEVTFDNYILNTTSKKINGIWYELVDEDDIVRLKDLLKDK